MSITKRQYGKCERVQLNGLWKIENIGIGQVVIKLDLLIEMDVHWVEEKAIWFARSPALHGNRGGGGGVLPYKRLKGMCR